MVRRIFSSVSHRQAYRLKEGYPIQAIHDLYPWVEMKTLEGAIEIPYQILCNGT